jgi:sugar lactone lactonase YvrE
LPAENRSANNAHREEVAMARSRSGKFTVLVPIVALVGFVGTAVYPQTDVPPVNDLPNPYETVRNWGTLPEGRTWGSTAGIDMDPDGRSVWAVDRCGANTCAGSNLPVVLKFDSSGKLLKSFGAGMFIFPHGLHVDREGNVWVTDGRTATPQELEKFPDAKGKGHTVVKFSPDGKVLMTLGTSGAAGNPPDHLNEPTDVVTAPNGDIFVGDGHSGQNPKAPPDTIARIVKFDRNGKFLKTWGKWGAAQGDFKTPHALVFDSRGRLLVADRGNHRIQIFNQDGQFLLEWRQFSRISGLYVRNDMLYAIDSESNANNHPGWRKGVRIGSLKDGKVTYFIPPHMTDTPEGAAGEGIAVDSAGNVFTAENTVRGLTKYIKRLGTR